MDRNTIEPAIKSMISEIHAKLTEAIFEKDGRVIPYRKASLTRDAEDLDEAEPLDLLVKDAIAAPAKGKRKVAPAAKGKLGKTRTPALARDSDLEAKLRAWRMAEAKRRNVPAFRIFSDATLKALAEQRPATARELLAIPGIGMNTVEKIGAQIYRLIHEGGRKDGAPY